MKKFNSWCLKVKSKVANELKNPLFYIGFGITYILLESPVIFGTVMYFITKEAKYLAIASSWFALTAPALPIPVIPLSICGGLLISKIKKRV